MDKYIRPQFRIMLIYLIFGLLWIYLSDELIAFSFESKTAMTLAQNIKGWAFIAITSALLFFLVKRDFDAQTRASNRIIESYEQTIYAWAHVMELRHKETRAHTDRVMKMTVELAKLCGITNETELKNIERGAVLHDIGKIGIPDAILIKPDKLDEKEWLQMKKHPTLGHELLSKIAFLQPSLDIPYYHHEKWNGQGYPRGLKGEEIPLEARVFAVIDVWDALSNPRVYKAAWPEDKVLSYLQEESGQHFDPRIVKIFLDHYEQIKACGANHAPREGAAHKQAEHSA